MMSLTQPHRQALGAIADGLAGSDPRLASMLTIFSRLAAGEEMPAHGTIRALRGRPRARRPRRGMAPPHARQLYPRLGWPLTMFLLWAVISAALVAVALALSTSGPKACIRSMGTACPSPSSLQHADASPVDEPAASRGGLPDRQPAGA